MDFDQLIDRYGGVVTTRQMITSGETTESIRRAVDTGALTRIRHGWYQVPAADPEVVRAVADEGVVSCATALRRHGLWVPEHSTVLHSRVTRYERRHSHDRCRRHGRPTPATAAVDDVPTALQYAARCFDVEGFVILCDSALNNGRLTIDDLRSEFRSAPMTLRRAVDKCERLAGSGTETAARLRLRSAGLTVEVQHEVPAVGFVDLLVGNRLVIELDSRAHHTGEANYETDRLRTRKLTSLGYLTMRLTYAQVFTGWAATYADIQRTVQQGYHRSRGTARTSTRASTSTEPTA
ncbi:type IV toxin-antitoxin system AbiEi family antitoxin domain-containing protein [Gordonia sp. NPDC058843]|uniref:type IV toxin-antitoxin system AbiEi family antitoxin domain-containing protein n=1 Tax=Gordonia sp. NPDC058843 TaxID=3346648 RepID=UPI0036AD6D44